MQYYDIITNSRWWTDANMKIVFMSANHSESRSDCYEIWYTESDSNYDKIYHSYYRIQFHQIS